MEIYKADYCTIFRGQSEAIAAVSAVALTNKKCVLFVNVTKRK